MERRGQGDVATHHVETRHVHVDARRRCGEKGWIRIEDRTTRRNVKTMEGKRQRNRMDIGIAENKCLQTHERICEMHGIPMALASRVGDGGKDPMVAS